MKLKIISFFIWNCMKIWTNPRNFFQIHSQFFDEKKWIFSKLDLEDNIPQKRRLQSYKIQSSDTVDSLLKKCSLPCIWKPEWWQNAHWVRLITTEQELKKFLWEAKNSEISYLIQEYSHLSKEFELS